MQPVQPGSAFKCHAKMIAPIGVEVKYNYNSLKVGLY